MPSILERAASAIADFNNPFYAEERQRDVANEADAVGFWMLFWTLLWGTGATFWFFPRYWPFAGVMAGWACLVSLIANRYARRLGVDGIERDRRASPWRHVLVLLTGAWVGIGFAQAMSPDARGWQVPYLVGFLGVGIPIVVVKERRRRSR